MTAVVDEVLVCRLDDLTFAVPSSQVQEVIRAVLLLPPPVVDPYLLGVIDCRGQLIGVIDLWTFLGTTPRKIVESDSLVIVTSSFGPFAVPASAVEQISSTVATQGSEASNAPRLIGRSDLGSILICTSDAIGQSAAQTLLLINESQVDVR